MQALTKMDLMALALQQIHTYDLNSPSVFSRLRGGYSWKEDEGVLYSPFDDEMSFFTDELLYGPNRDLLEGIRFERVLLRDDELRPHWHANQDNVIFIPSLGCPGLFQAYYQIKEQRGIWVPLTPGQTMHIPRRSVHGFRRNSDAASDEPVLIVVATYGQSDHDDIHYVDV